MDAFFGRLGRVEQPLSDFEVTAWRSLLRFGQECKGFSGCAAGTSKMLLIFVVAFFFVVISLTILSRYVLKFPRVEEECEDEDLDSVGVSPEAAPTITDCLGTNFVNGDGKTVTLADLAGKNIGVYFSAQWCLPCRGFTPELVKTYNKLNAANKKFEIIFASSDQDEAAFQQYFRKMPWLALPYADRERKRQLSNLFNINGIPTFVMLDADLNVINADARAAVEADPEGENFPWPSELHKEIVEVRELQRVLESRLEALESTAEHLDAEAERMENMGREHENWYFWLPIAIASASLVMSLRRRRR
jgi:thiol-disulfide isomerase/thioredoxin